MATRIVNLCIWGLLLSGGCQFYAIGAALLLAKSGDWAGTMHMLLSTAAGAIVGSKILES
jgi:hypothetical protein